MNTANHLIDRANEVIERVLALDDEIANMWAFRTLSQAWQLTLPEMADTTPVHIAAVFEEGFLAAGLQKVAQFLG